MPRTEGGGGGGVTVVVVGVVGVPPTCGGCMGVGGGGEGGAVCERCVLAVRVEGYKPAAVCAACVCLSASCCCRSLNLLPSHMHTRTCTHTLHAPAAHPLRRRGHHPALLLRPLRPGGKRAPLRLRVGGAGGRHRGAAGGVGGEAAGVCGQLLLPLLFPLDAPGAVGGCGGVQRAVVTETGHDRRAPGAGAGGGGGLQVCAGEGSGLSVCSAGKGGRHHFGTRRSPEGGGLSPQGKWVVTSRGEWLG